MKERRTSYVRGSRGKRAGLAGETSEYAVVSRETKKGKKKGQGFALGMQRIKRGDFGRRGTRRKLGERKIQELFHVKQRKNRDRHDLTRERIKTKKGMRIKERETLNKEPTQKSIDSQENDYDGDGKRWFSGEVEGGHGSRGGKDRLRSGR